MKCKDCKYMELAPEGNGLYVCHNEHSFNYQKYTEDCCENDCGDGNY